MSSVYSASRLRYLQPSPASDISFMFVGSDRRVEVGPHGRLPGSSASIEGILRLPGSSGFSLTYHLSVLSAWLSLQVTPAVNFPASLALPSLK